MEEGGVSDAGAQLVGAKLKAMGYHVRDVDGNRGILFQRQRGLRPPPAGPSAYSATPR